MSSCRGQRRGDMKGYHTHRHTHSHTHIHTHTHTHTHTHYSWKHSPLKRQHLTPDRSLGYCDRQTPRSAPQSCNNSRPGQIFTCNSKAITSVIMFSVCAARSVCGRPGMRAE